VGGLVQYPAAVRPAGPHPARRIRAELAARPDAMSRPLRGPRPGRRRLRRRSPWRTRLPRSRRGDAPREDTGPPLSVKAGCDRGATADCQAAWHMYTRSPALSAEPLAAPWAGKTGRPRPAPPRARRARDHCGPAHQRTPGNEVNWRSTARRRRENHTNPVTGRTQGCALTAGSGPASDYQRGAGTPPRNTRPASRETRVSTKPGAVHPLRSGRKPGGKASCGGESRAPSTTRSGLDR
jgi:hypothetical protein